MRYDEEFLALVNEIVEREEYRKTKDCRHHIKVSVYDHSLRVAWLCYRHCKRFGSKEDAREAVRGALLHDLYLYDREREPQRRRRHARRHPWRALLNASRLFPDLSEAERDAILNHMFPLTGRAPKTRVGRLVCFYDKLAAIADVCGKNRWKK